MTKLIAICGKSASGKDSVLSRLLELYPNDFHRKIAYTTRAQRENEVQGKDYYFRTHEQMFDLILKEQIFEATEFNNEFYGTGVDSLVDGKINVGMFDPFGIETLSNEKDIELLIVYVKVEDRIRWQRILSRDKDKTIDEIYERHKVDEQAFKHFESLYDNILILENEIENLDRVASVIKTTSDVVLK